MIYNNVINAYVIIPTLTSVKSSKISVPTDMNNKYVKFDSITNTSVYTFQPEHAIDCAQVMCPMSLTKTNGTYRFL
jgi:hypothetical protein